MKRALAVVILAWGLLTASSGRAMFGEENVALYKIWWQNLQQTLKLRELLKVTQEASEFAKETAGFAHAAMQVGRNAQSIINDPQRYFMYAISTWYDQFPELQVTLSNAYTARDLFDAATQPQNLPEYDAYAYNRAFDALTMLTSSGFETLAHAVDTFGINDPHDRAVKVIAQQRDIAMDNLEEVAAAMNSTGLTLVDASVHTARATSVSAVAQVQATATLERMSRTLELQFAAEQRSEKAAEIERLSQDAAASRLHLKSWHLDPMPSRLGTDAERP